MSAVSNYISYVAGTAKESIAELKAKISKLPAKAQNMGVKTQIEKLMHFMKQLALTI